MKGKQSDTAVIGLNCSIKDSVKIGENVTIGNNVTIYDNVTIGNNVYIWDNVVIGKIPMGVATNFRKLNNRQEPITIGDNCVIACNAIIYCGVNLESNCLISENAIIRENTHISHDVIIGGNALIQYEVNIESGTRILNNSIISSKSRIGKNNFISWGFTSVSDKAFGGKGYTDDIIGPIIGNNNHIGPNVTMLSNIEIGNGNIIGACALISKSIGNNGVYYGIPAKFVKENKSDI